MKEEFIEKIYSGWLGKVIGVIHGANIEGWTRAEIERTFGEISDYPFTFKNFCSDDDINGPAFFQRSILDYGADPSLKELALTFLNYVSDGHGFFWWGGYGISTEDTAYHNLVEGVLPGVSGSAAQNGTVLCNQIGGQIFSDCWGLMWPGNPRKAADYAEKMASLTHDQDGLAGARFVAAAVAAAFTAKTAEEILEQALGQLPQGSAYAKMAEDVSAFTREHLDDWRICFDYVKEHYDYRYYSGVCHILPNAAVMILALLCGKGSYENTINIAAMCGWDTDCNEGNLGTILGVFAGVEGIRKNWISQVRDLVICSGALGGLNIQTVPQIAENTLRAVSVLQKEEWPETWKEILQKSEGRYFHFQFPGSTHGIRINHGGNSACMIRNTARRAYIGMRSLLITHPQFGNNNWFEIGWKSYYRPDEFDDNRYQPDLSPVLYPGDQVTFHYSFAEEELGKQILVQAYKKDRISDKEEILWCKEITVEDTKWHSGRMDLPSASNQIIEEIGVRITGQNVAPREQNRSFQIYLGDVEILPAPDYRMEASELFDEIWTAVDTNPVGFSYLRGAVGIWDGKIGLSGAVKPAELYTGMVDWENYCVSAEMVPEFGTDHYLLGRVQGAMRWYAGGLIELDGKRYAAILKKDREIHILEKSPFEWKHGCCAHVEFEVQGETLVLSVNGVKELEVRDSDYREGCIGFGNQFGSRTAFTGYSVKAKK